MWTQIRLQSDHGLYSSITFQQTTKSRRLFLVGAFRVNIIQRYQTSIISYCLLVGGRVVAFREMALIFGLLAE